MDFIPIILAVTFLVVMVVAALLAAGAELQKRGWW